MKHFSELKGEKNTHRLSRILKQGVLMMLELISFHLYFKFDSVCLGICKMTLNKPEKKMPRKVKRKYG